MIEKNIKVVVVVGAVLVTLLIVRWIVLLNMPVLSFLIVFASLGAFSISLSFWRSEETWNVKSSLYGPADGRSGVWVCGDPWASSILTSSWGRGAYPPARKLGDYQRTGALFLKHNAWRQRQACVRRWCGMSVCAVSAFDWYSYFFYNLINLITHGWKRLL